MKAKLNNKRLYENKVDAMGNVGTADEPCLILYMDPVSFYEATAGFGRFHAYPSFPHSDRCGSLEVEVRFRRWFNIPDLFIESTFVEGDTELAKTLGEPNRHLRTVAAAIPFDLRGAVRRTLRDAEIALQQVGRTPGGVYCEGVAHFLVLAVLEFEKAGHMADFPLEYWEELLRAVEWLGLIGERQRILEFVGSTTLHRQQALAESIRLLENARWRPFHPVHGGGRQQVGDLAVGRLQLAQHCIANAKQHQDMEGYFSAHCILAAEELEAAGRLADFPRSYWDELLIAVEWLGLIEHRKRILNKIVRLSSS